MYGIPKLHRLMIILRYRLAYIIQLFYKYLFGILSPLARFSLVTRTAPVAPVMRATNH